MRIFPIVNKTKKRVENKRNWGIRIRQKSTTTDALTQNISRFRPFYANKFEFTNTLVRVTERPTKVVFTFSKSMCARHKYTAETGIRIMRAEDAAAMLRNLWKAYWVFKGSLMAISPLWNSTVRPCSSSAIVPVFPPRVSFSPLFSPSSSFLPFFFYSILLLSFSLVAFISRGASVALSGQSRYEISKQVDPRPSEFYIKRKLVASRWKKKERSFSSFPENSWKTVRL